MVAGLKNNTHQHRVKRLQTWSYFLLCRLSSPDPLSLRSCVINSSESIESAGEHPHLIWVISQRSCLRPVALCYLSLTSLDRHGTMWSMRVITLESHWMMMGPTRDSRCPGACRNATNPYNHVGGVTLRGGRGGPLPCGLNLMAANVTWKPSLTLTTLTTRHEFTALHGTHHTYCTGKQIVNYLMTPQASHRKIVVEDGVKLFEKRKEERSHSLRGDIMQTHGVINAHHL